MEQGEGKSTAAVSYGRRVLHVGQKVLTKLEVKLRRTDAWKKIELFSPHWLREEKDMENASSDLSHYLVLLSSPHTTFEITPTFGASRFLHFTALMNSETKSSCLLIVCVRLNNDSDISYNY